MKSLIALALFTTLTGCMSTKLQLSPKWNPSVPATYEDYVDYYFLGFVGEPTLNLQKICMDQKPQGLQRIKSVEDGVINFFTMGIYTPATVRVWCGD